MKSLNRPLNYNESKVKSNDASLLLAANFLQEKEDLTFYDKTSRFEQLMKLNARAKEKVVHISVNFSPADRIEQAELVQMAEEYMEKIGFGDQPYLVYQHYDAAHLHVHIVSTLIKPDGKRISTHNLESVKSLAVCREMELKYGLVKAEKKKKEQEESVHSDNFLKVVYGKTPTKRGITNVLDAVIDRYKYGSLEELNAILKLFNVMADRGPEDGVVYKTGGLYYRVLDDDGNIMGKPIKASSIYSKPTLVYLQQKFAENKLTRDQLKSRVKTAVDWLMRTNPKITLPELIEGLKREKIHLLLRQSEHLIYGMTYVDLKNKVVFNGSDLGKPYAANGILQRIARQIPTEKQPIQTVAPLQYTAEFAGAVEPKETNKQHPSKILSRHSSSKAVYPIEYLPYELTRNKRRKKRKRIR